MRLSKLLLAASLLAPGAVCALDMPHAYDAAKGAASPIPQDTCAGCHKPHGASGPGLTTDASNANLCISCHTSKGTGGINAWSAAADQAVVGTSGSSHRWDTAPANSSYGATTPTSPDLASRLSSGKLQCSTCHDQHSQLDAPADPNAPAYGASTVTRRHFQRIPNDQNQMCVDCHAAWKETTVSSRAYAGAGSANFNSHPVLSKDGATSLSLPAAGGGSDFTYRQIPLDAPMRFKASGGTTTTVTVDATRYTLATGIAPSFILRFTSGKNANVPANISGVNVATGTITLAAALGSAPVAGDAFEIDRVADTTGWEIADAAGTLASIAMSTAKAWPVTGGNVPVGATATILATPAAAKADVGKVCTISSNTATSITFSGCTPSALSVAPAASTVFRINWPEGNAGAATASTTTTITDGTKGWPVNGLVGLSVLVTSGASQGKLGLISANTATQITFSPALASALAVNDTYEIRPYQVGPYAGSVSTGSLTGITAAGAPAWPTTAAGLKNLVVRFTGGVARGQAAVISANTANTLTFASVATAPSAGDTFEIDLDGNASNNVHLAAMGSAGPSFTTGTVACTSCHGPHYADSDSGTYDDQPRTGDGRLLRRAFQPAGAGGAGGNDETCDGCHNTKMHSSIVTGSKYGAWGASFTCGTCHQPHQTNNIYLIRPTINTPTSGAKSVALQKTTGMAAGSFATAAGGGTTGTLGPCEACHTQTTHYNNLGTGTSHYTSTCTGCHTHVGGFAGAGESGGGQDCSGCHTFFTNMNGASNYHHYMNNAAATPYPTAAPGGTSDTNRRCIMCHVDHNIFRPDLNASGKRAANLRTDIAVTPSTSAGFTSADFDPVAGGICISCHKNSLAKSYSQSDATTTTPALATATFAASAHNFAATSGFGDSSTFQANCSKCHNDTLTKDKQTSTNKFGLHDSTLRSMNSAMNLTSAPDPLEERLCWRCHSKTTDTGATVAPAKTVALRDYYNATAMTTSAEAVYTVFNGAGYPFDHPVTSTSGLHRVTGEGNAASDGTLSGAKRHVSCADCHNPHAVKPVAAANARGTLTGFTVGTPDTLADSTKTWTPGQWTGYTVEIVTGTGAGQSSAIYGNTATALSADFTTAPAVGSGYVILPYGSPNGNQLSPAMTGAWGLNPTFPTQPTPPTWNDSAGGPTNAADLTTQYTSIATWGSTSAPALTGQVCIKCHSAYAYGTTPPSTLSGMPGSSATTWSNTVGAAMPQSDLANQFNPNNLAHHAVFARGKNQPLVSSATVTSTYNPNWPKFTTGTVSTAACATPPCTVTLAGSTWPITVLPGWFIYVGSATPAQATAGWFEVKVVTDSTHLTVDRATSALSAQPFMLTAGLGNNFVPPFGPWSTLSCTDCHASDTTTDPFGPHGSGTKWLLRKFEPKTFDFYDGTSVAAVAYTTTTDNNNLCLNCHRRDVYGDYNFNPPTTGTGLYSRQQHPADSGTPRALQTKDKWGIVCMNCHGGARSGTIHGTNLGQGNGGTAGSYSGKRLLAGSTWYAVTRSTTAAAGSCWTKGATDNVDNCGHTHANAGFQSGVAKYNYDTNP